MHIPVINNKLNVKSKIQSNLKTRSVFANDKFVILMQDVTRQRKILEKWDYASLHIFLNFKREKDCSLISKEKDCLSEHSLISKERRNVCLNIFLNFKREKDYYRQGKCWWRNEQSGLVVDCIWLKYCLPTLSWQGRFPFYFSNKTFTLTLSVSEWLTDWVSEWLGQLPVQDSRIELVNTYSVSTRYTATITERSDLR